MSPRDVLRTLIAQHAVKQGGPFRLASGGESSVIIDLSLALRSREAMDLLAAILFEYIPRGITAVGGPGLGSDPVAVACLLVAPELQWFTVRETAKTHGFDLGKVTGRIQKGDRVLLVEDVVTTGRSLCNAARAVQESGLVVAGGLAVVNRGDAFEQRWADEFADPPPFHWLFSLAEILGARK